ncbi:hypothetical protein K470DRAFT_245782 [Piedraia hortae CBS 480.64]|uniref:MARVEL domain-containing protein n=1 Tax=Piedraia hortae CBS 480.64 TaxID=1314780 RepID=A0A6A7C3U1_9PEZI|nr:hypothetical protein K470DRAFT_245782 [Piedraia hortae CBS 480.64]
MSKPTFSIDTRSLSSSSIQQPRPPRFAEATTVHSPISPTNHYIAQPQDVGHQNPQIVEMPDTTNTDYPRPLKSALKTPGAPPTRTLFSPTFNEEQLLEKEEKHTEKQQAHDLKIKTRVRIAKFLLRGVNFSCSLIVLGMLSTTFTIFNATRSLPPRNSLPPWSHNQETWPQLTLLVISIISLLASTLILYNYTKGGHKRAERAAAYYTAFSITFFIISIVIWGMGAGILQSSRSSSDKKNFWGWACADTRRKELFKDQVDYDLVCRLQSWSLICCVIEIVVETLTIMVYGVVLWRLASKRKLRKSMAYRDRARGDLYLKKLGEQSAPNTPGFAPGGYGIHGGLDGRVEEGLGRGETLGPAQEFKLQAPPIRVQKATPVQEQEGGFEAAPEGERVAAAPGEKVYESVPIPGAYR